MLWVSLHNILHLYVKVHVFKTLGGGGGGGGCCHSGLISICRWIAYIKAYVIPKMTIYYLIHVLVQFKRNWQVHVFLWNDRWKTQINMNVVIQTQSGGRIGECNMEFQWNKVWSTAVPNNSLHDDGTLQVEAGFMMVFPSKSYLGYKKTKSVNWSLLCLCRLFMQGT